MWAHLGSNLTANRTISTTWDSTKDGTQSHVLASMEFEPGDVRLANSVEARSGCVASCRTTARKPNRGDIWVLCQPLLVSVI
jgi:hypothetical protein